MIYRKIEPEIEFFVSWMEHGTIDSQKSIKSYAYEKESIQASLILLFSIHNNKNICMYENRIQLVTEKNVSTKNEKRDNSKMYMS